MATSVEACLLGEAQTFIISDTTIQIISLRNRGFGLFFLSTHCIKASGKFFHGITKLSTQSTAAIGRLGDGEAENEECDEEDGEANGNWLKVSVLCAVKQKKLNKRNVLNALFILGDFT